MNLRYLIIKVKDLQRANGFYTRLLSMSPTKEEVGRMVVFDVGTIKLGLYNPLADKATLEEADFGTNCIPAFGVEDLEQELKRISSFAQVVSHGASGTHKWFEFQDTEGNTLEVHKV